VGAGRLRRAHVAIALAFVAFGTIDGTWVARLPALKQRLGLDSGELGLVIFSVSLTATLLLPLSGWLTSRRGSRGPAGLEPKPVTSPTAAAPEAGRTPERTLAAFALSAGATAATAGLFLYFACSLFSSCLGPDTSKQLVASVGLVTVVAYSLFWTVFK